jgi:hypothetical protein
VSASKRRDAEVAGRKKSGKDCRWAREERGDDTSQTYL